MTIALITGGSRGLGKSMALHLAKAGTDSILTYKRAASEAAMVVKGIEAQGRRAVALQLDVEDSRSFGAFAEQVKSALRETWQRDDFDALVNNAGHGLHASIEQTTEEDFDSLFKVHVKAPYFLTQKLLPLLKDGGRIINVSSGLARFALPGSSAYAMAKGAVEVLTRYQAKELGGRRIAVNTIAPGAIATDFRGGAIRDNPQAMQMVAGMTALGRVGEADDIGLAVTALLGEGGRWINGQRIEASGGMFL